MLGRLTDFFGLGRERPVGELWETAIPDLLSPAGGLGPDHDQLINLLDLAFLGRASAGEIDRELDAMPCGTTNWVPDHFAEDLFLAELVRDSLGIELRSQVYRAHAGFLGRVLTTPPPDLETIRYRQAILRELEANPHLAEAIDELLVRVMRLLTLLRASRDDARLEPIRFRFDVLHAFRAVVTQMAQGFCDATSGLQRLFHEGRRIADSAAYGRLEALLDHNEAMATLELAAIVGADGRLRHLEIRSFREQKKNPFFRRPLRRWWDRMRIFYRRYDLHSSELVERMVMGVYHDVAPALARTVQLVCHLEVYAAARSFAVRARDRGLEVSLPEISPDPSFEIEGLFNPLLFSLTDKPVPTDLTVGVTPITLVTGPNSGGKTRLLQAIGIAQVMAQCGIYAPCARAKLGFASGLFASIVEADRADQSEGRLGTEMVRLRTLFENVPPRSLVLLDELCSGTNPSEAIEIVEIVLRLLHQLKPSAFVTTHFLDFANQLQSTHSLDGLGFLQAEVDDEHGATFRFIRGVATTSLAVGTARRLGVTFEELEQTLGRRAGNSAHDLVDDEPQH
jgi:DNA mismatch repair protein MutS2